MRARSKRQWLARIIRALQEEDEREARRLARHRASSFGIPLGLTSDGELVTNGPWLGTDRRAPAYRASLP